MKVKSSAGPAPIAVTFTLLAAVGIGLTVAAGAFTDLFVRGVLMHTGSAVFGGSLAFFLIEMFRWNREK